MSTDKHYNPAIYVQLQKLAVQQDWQGIVSYTDSLSHAMRRTAGYILGERIAPGLPEEEMWRLVQTLTGHDAKAYLVTMTKAIALRLANGEVHLRSGGSRAFMAQVRGNAVDRQKVASLLLPVLDQPEDIRWLLRHLDVEEGRDRLALLLRIPTKAASYALFCTLRYAEHDRPLLVRTAHFLIQRGDGLGFNLASLIRTYYGLDEVKGTFSLHVQPYQLARIESSFDAFCDIMKL